MNASFAPGTYVAKQYTILTRRQHQRHLRLGHNTNLPANFTSTLSYDANNAYLNLALAFMTSAGGLNGNQHNVANALINFFNTTGGIPMVFGTLTPPA